MTYKENSLDGGYDSEACGIISNNPIPKKCGIYYYEIEIIPNGFN